MRSASPTMFAAAIAVVLPVPPRPQGSFWASAAASAGLVQADLRLFCRDFSGFRRYRDDADAPQCAASPRDRVGRFSGFAGLVNHTIDDIKNKLGRGAPPA